MWRSQVIMQVDSRTQDLLEAGKVALEVIGEDKAAADMKGGAAATDNIKLEVWWSEGVGCGESHERPLDQGGCRMIPFFLPF